MALSDEDKKVLLPFAAFSITDAILWFFAIKWVMSNGKNGIFPKSLTSKDKRGLLASAIIGIAMAVQYVDAAPDSGKKQAK